VTLDLARVVTSIAEMVATVDPAHERHRFDALRHLWDTLDSDDVNDRLDQASTSFLLARQPADYRARFALPDVLTSYAIAATDGSMILPDRHSPARFYLINTSKVYLRYGDNPFGDMSADAVLRYSEDDLWIDGSTRRVPVNEVIIGLRRATAELLAAVELLEGEPLPSIALLDGTLILWSLVSLDPAIASEVLPDFLKALRAFKERRQPVASYISAPNAADLMNTMRVAICDYPPRTGRVDCNDCWRRTMTEGHTPFCDILPGVPDRFLLGEIASLCPGERSQVFDSDSSILDSYGADLRICFFYVHSGREIARIEIPRWVANDPELLDRVHAIVWDQAQLGRGYPVALQEAHEQAVLSMSDRRLVEELVERRLASQGIVVTHTGKDGSKRGRFV
jgi:hypothetical protein